MTVSIEVCGDESYEWEFLQISILFDSFFDWDPANKNKWFILRFVIQLYADDANAVLLWLLTTISSFSAHRALYFNTFNTFYGRHQSKNASFKNDLIIIFYFLTASYDKN